AVSHRVSVPILIGWLRPMILLPETLTDRQGDPHRDAILVHELAHVRRHDYVWQLILRTVQVLYWPHPLTWLTGRLVIATREQACDQLCVHALADPLRYRATLLDVAAGLVRRPRHRPAWVGAPMARTPRLASRLRGIDRAAGIARCLPRLPVRACIIALALAAIGVIGPIELARRSAEAKQPARETATSQPATASAATSDPAVATAPTATRPAPVPLQPTTQSTWRPGRTINISVVQAETGKPLPDVPLEIYFGKDNEYTAKTDRQGWCLVKLPDKEPYWATITATPKGMVHRQAHFRGYSRRFDIPEQYTLRLTPGTVIGGIVQDPAGKPIKGASVCIDMSCADEMDHVHIHDQVAKTDADGKWQCDVIPPDASEVRLSVTHPNYVARDRDYGASPPPIEQLRDKTYTVTLAKGIVIQGTVTDLDGKPIEGALIILGQELPDELPQTKTDAKGQYRLACAAAGVNFVTVYAKGHVPDQKRLVAAADIPPVDFRLGPPYIIHGRVLDPQGRPLKGARVSPNRWRGLWINEFHFDTDDQGRFRWDNAPPDTIAFYVAKKGYQTLPNYPLSPSTADHVIRLQPTPIVKGAVVDAETGRPIPKFKVLLSDEDSDRTTWKTDKTFGTGRYEVAFDDLQKRYRVRIEAEGYKPAISQDIPPGASEHTCNFRLVKSDLTVAAATSPTTTQPSAATAQPPIPPAEALGTIVRSLFGRSPAKNRRRKVSVEGVITDSDAHPIPKAEVFLCQRVIGSKLLKTTTDAQGKFQMDQARLGEGILAAHAPGYAPSQGKIRLTKDKLTIQMRLAPGELLQGRVVDNNQRPLNAARLTATNWGDVELTGLDTSLDLDLKTDADGRFRYDHAPPEGVVYTICKEGYQSAEDLHLKPSPSPHLIALHPAAIVHGSVTDAKTGKAVWECQIEQGLVRQDGKIDWSARDETFTEGRYKIHFDGQAHAYRFRVSADGYRPAVSPSFSPGQLDAIHDVKLEPTDDLRGSVLLPDGKPLAGGIVTLLMPSQYSFVIDGKPLHLPDLPLRTRGDGSFTLHPQAEPFGLLVVDERGWAEVPSDQFAANPEIRLQPWARVEGIYRVGGKPVSDVKLGLRWREPDRKRLPEVDYTYNARTDANGRFVFQRVRPGTIKIAEDWRSGEGELPSGYDVTVTVKPGETKQVNIGGPGDAPMGRLVIGRIVPPPGSARDIDWNQDQSAYLYRSDDDLDESLLSLALKSPLKRLPKLRTDREVDPSRPESYHFRITPDGSFRIDDVVHGSYRMHVTVKKDAPDGWDEMRGELEHSFTVSAAFRDARNKPTDLGELVITLYNTPQPGDQAPLIEIPPSHEQLPGRRGARKTFRLADYVGPKSARKVVLLTFWTNPFRPRPWLDAFKAIHDAFAGDDRLVMVVILEPKRDRGEAKDFWSKDLAEAIRVPVGAYEAKSTLNAYGLPGMIGQQPRVFLIATDGTVLAANLHPNAIKPAIATALSSTRKSASTSAPTPTATQPAARERKANDVQQAALDFRAVQRPDGSPLPGVSLRIAGANVATAETNAKGKCTIPLPENRAISLFITADKPGFVPVQVVWSNGDDPAK
ncbi:MAG: carboxypeptidase regulatory-like domain-containing protein, partial [Phycisphaerae bacterium]|nr:carboxypeptidase regulatory-like domain-containing protein [Phycisphaerae bacterium]